MIPMRKAYPWLLLAALLLVVGACFGGSKNARRYSKEQMEKTLQQLETPGLVLGEFPLAKNAIVDGDTIKVAGLKSSMRLVNIDTEETFKSEADRRLYETGWDNYLKAKQSLTNHPVKIASPMGEEAKVFAKAFFDGVDTVRLERDNPKGIRDMYDRYLAYVFVQKNGEWVNYNVEAVRAGITPYFTKYGYSRRFHDAFVQAQKEAQQALRGIWDPAKTHYPDYVMRLEWWDARADFVRAFETEAKDKDKDNFIDMADWDSMRRLEKFVGKEVTVLGVVGDVKLRDTGPVSVNISRRKFGGFPLVFFDRDVFGTSRIARFVGEYVKVTGPVAKYTNPYTGREDLQMIINLPGQIVGSDKVPIFPGTPPETLDDGEVIEEDSAPEAQEQPAGDKEAATHAP